jgi:hypothetical protein
MIANKNNTITQSIGLEIFNIFKCPLLICPTWTFSLSMIFSPSFQNPSTICHEISSLFMITLNYDSKLFDVSSLSIHGTLFEISSNFESDIIQLSSDFISMTFLSSASKMTSDFELSSLTFHETLLIQISSVFSSDKYLISSAFVLTEVFDSSEMAFSATDFIERATVGNTIAIISGTVSGVVIVSILAIVIIYRLKQNRNNEIHQNSSHSDDLTKEVMDDTTIDTVTGLSESTLFGSLLDDGQLDWQTQSVTTIPPSNDTLCDD